MYDPQSSKPSSKYYNPSSNGMNTFGKSTHVDRLLEAKLLSNLRAHPPSSISTSNSMHNISDNNNSNNHTHHVAPTKSSTNHNNNNDRDLLTIMASRLAKLEDSLKDYKAELTTKDKAIVELKKKANDATQESARLKKEQQALKNQIHEMETFLNDYGLVWVGGDDVGDDEGVRDDVELDVSDNVDSSLLDDDDEDDLVYKDGADEYPLVGGEKQFKLDMERVKRNIAELNILAGEGKAEVVHTKGGMHRLKEPDSVSLTFYKNGFLLFSGPFRPYNLPSSLPFIKDITDGYFPYELKDRYPNGVPFKLQDRSMEMYAPPKQPFSGAGSSLKKPATSHKQNIHGLSGLSSGNSNNSSSNQQQGGEVSKDDFLKKLPASVIKNGRVIDIRKSIAANMFKASEPSADNVVIASTAVVSYLCGGSTPSVPAATSQLVTKVESEEGIFAAEYKGRPTTPHTITTLKIKTGNIGTLIVKLNFDDTVATLRKYIDQYTKENGAYELRTTFPNRVYTNPHATLLSEGLVPNATMYMKTI